ncbi:universal stress protein [Halorubrum sp. DTA98]|uniref:universal stress protein n=1 Tax=Halorubrum sp. DTA98 TaxID=3402163 RepID=UPI003AB012C5
MYDTILLPVAPGGTANDAVPHVRSLAERYDATVHVVAAVDTIEHTLGGPRVGSLSGRVESGARKRVEEVTADLESAGIDVVGEVIHGEPLRVIDNAITDNDVDLVVMPTHSRTGLQRVLLGSVTEKTVRTSPVPVVTVPIRDPDE